MYIRVTLPGLFYRIFSNPVHWSKWLTANVRRVHTHTHTQWQCYRKNAATLTKQFHVQQPVYCTDSGETLSDIGVAVWTRRTVNLSDLPVFTALYTSPDDVTALPSMAVITSPERTPPLMSQHTAPQTSLDLPLTTLTSQHTQHLKLHQRLTLDNSDITTHSTSNFTKDLPLTTWFTTNTILHSFNSQFPGQAAQACTGMLTILDSTAPRDDGRGSKDNSTLHIKATELWNTCKSSPISISSQTITTCIPTLGSLQARCHSMTISSFSLTFHDLCYFPWFSMPGKWSS